MYLPLYRRNNYYTAVVLCEFMICPAHLVCRGGQQDDVRQRTTGRRRTEDSLQKRQQATRLVAAERQARRPSCAAAARRLGELPAPNMPGHNPAAVEAMLKATNPYHVRRSPPPPPPPHRCCLCWVLMARYERRLRTRSPPLTISRSPSSVSGCRYASCGCKHGSTR